MQLHLAEFTQEEIADKLGMARTVACRDLQSFRDAWRNGDSPDPEEAPLLRGYPETGTGTLHVVRYAN